MISCENISLHLCLYILCGRAVIYKENQCVFKFGGEGGEGDDEKEGEEGVERGAQGDVLRCRSVSDPERFITVIIKVCITQGFKCRHLAARVDGPQTPGHTDSVTEVAGRSWGGTWN